MVVSALKTFFFARSPTTSALDPSSVPWPLEAPLAIAVPMVYLSVL
jgi:hypothetical protein